MFVQIQVPAMVKGQAQWCVHSSKVKRKCWAFQICL